MIIRRFKTENPYSITLNYIDGSEGWHCIAAPNADIYEAEEIFKDDGVFGGNSVKLVNFSKDEEHILFEKRENLCIGEPIWDGKAFYFITVDFDENAVRIYRYFTESRKKEKISCIELSSIKDCYNLRLALSPLTLVRGNFDGSNMTEVIWPKKTEFKTEDRESFDFRDGDLFYFSKWYEDPDYHEEVIVKDFKGNIVERFPGSIHYLKDGSKCILEDKN